MTKEDLKRTDKAPPFVGGGFIADYLQREDKKSFDRVKLQNIIPTINGIKLID